MSFKEYALVEPDADSLIGKLLTKMASAEPYRAGRLVTALEEFIWNGMESGYRVVPEEGEGAVEIYIVPPRYVLAVPDAAALLRVDHIGLRIEIIRVIEEYGGPSEQSQWMEIRRIARDVL
jgi:hypothetical protein